MSQEAFSEQEAAYRRGWQQGFNEAERIILDMLSAGYERGKIRQLLAISNDQYVSQWREEGDLTQRELYSDCDIEQLEAIAATHHGYDWLLTDA
ncbi:MAG TPA: hypothetical protein VKV37_20540 [Ktedonobacteraceae bacterium]|nr:hypothetical protein [Ktedonobacteraceae bacterium]